MAKQLRIAVVGKTGNGKSSVANSIIGKNYFKTGPSADRVTKVTSSKTKRLSSGHVIEVFDTPGLYQEGEDASEIREEIEKSIVSPGLHAVVFVIKIGCFTKEEQEAVEQMKTLFGTSIFRFTIFAFTCINNLGTQPLEAFVHESAPVYLKDVISNSGARIVGFDNRDKTMDQKSVKKIISLLADMLRTNKECLYSRTLFQEAFQANMERKKGEQAKEEKERQMKFEKATAEKEAALNKKHEEDCNTLAGKQHQITSKQQQYWQETAEREKHSIESENSKRLGEMEERVKSGTNDLRDDMNVNTRVASDTQLEAKGPLLDSADAQQFKGENQPTKSGNDESFVAKGEGIASDIEPSVTTNDVVLYVRDTEVNGPGLHADEGRTGDTVNSSSTLQLPKSVSKVKEMLGETALKETVDRRTHTKQRGQESYGIPPNELRLVIIGKSGNGKSSTANTIIGKDFFKTGAAATSITKETNTHRASRFGKEIVLIDTPGFFDPEIEIKETEKEISRCMYMTLPGFHAFLLVVRVGRFTTEEMNTVKEFEKLFGEKLYDFMIIVFTRMDDLIREKRTLDDFVRHDIPPNLKQIIERCNQRYVGLNNIGSSKSKKNATKKVLKIIKTIIDSKDPNHYTNDAFKKAEKDLCQTIEAKTEILKTAKKAEFEEMFAEKEKKMREEHVTKIKEMKGVWDKERKQHEKEAKRILEEERELMEARFNADTKAMLEKERKATEELLNQHREKSERARKDIKDTFEEAIKWIQDDNAKKEMLAKESKDRFELEKHETEKLRRDIARKVKEDKEMYAKLMANHEKSYSELKKSLDNERKFRKNENESYAEEMEQRTQRSEHCHSELMFSLRERESDQRKHQQEMERQFQLFQNRLSDLEQNIASRKLEHEKLMENQKQYMEEEARKAAKKDQSAWFRFGKWMGFIYSE